MKLASLAIVLIAGLSCQPPAWADDQDVARAARERGVTAPFDEILAAARAVVPARTELLDATLLPNSGRPMVEVFLREQTGGRVVSVVVDARVAEVVSISGRAADAGAGRIGLPGPPAPAGDAWAGARNATGQGSGRSGEARGRGADDAGRRGSGPSPDGRSNPGGRGEPGGKGGRGGEGRSGDGRGGARP